jgi:hypothetical protein
MVQVPEQYADQVRRDRDALWPMVHQARAMAAAGDRAGLASTADAIRRRLRQGERSNGWLRFVVDDVVAAVDEVYDSAFPVASGNVAASAAAGTAAIPPDGRLRYASSVLDIPWPTASRRVLLSTIVDSPNSTAPLDGLAEEALSAPPSPVRTAVLRLVLCSPLGCATRDTTARVLEALHDADALDAHLVEAAFIADTYLGDAVYGRAPATGEAVPPAVGPGCAAAVRDHLDELTWRLTAEPNPYVWADTPRVPAPRGLRFVLRGLDVWAGRLPVVPGLHETDPYRAALADHLCGAELTDDERRDLVDLLRNRPEHERRAVFIRRYAVGDPEPLLALFGLERAGPLLRLLLALSRQGVGVLGGHAVRCDRDQLRATVSAVGEQAAHRLLALLDGPPAATEPVAAAMGWNRAAVLKRFGNHALQGIAAYGLLPVDPAEPILDRYLALRRSARKGATLGPNRRHSHAEAIDVALHHLAQVAGYPDASRLEWDLEARIAADSPGEWSAGDYAIAVRLDGAEPVIDVRRAGRTLKSVPAQVRKEPGYTQARTHQERLRDQARRMRTGLIEGLVATGGTVGRDELARLLSLPAGAAMLPALIWRDASVADSTVEGGAVGLLDAAGTSLTGLDGGRRPVTGAIAAVHPWQLFQAGSLAAWQAEVVRRHLRQPVKQAFRELYVLTAAECTAGTTSLRFAGHVVDGKAAAQLLSGRGWSIHRDYDDRQATRAVDGLTAGLACGMRGYFGAGPVTIGAVSFSRDGAATDLSTVPPVAFSEVMRDVDLVVSVAGTGAAAFSTVGTTSRAELLAALIADLGLDRVTVTGHTATVRGTRATYRVHLGGGSIHVEPGRHLCVVPASFGQHPHRRLFLPFVDEDVMTSMVLSKVLLLAEDDKITDESILSQLKRGVTGTP